MSKEVWKPVKGFRGDYEVSDHGNVRNRHTGRILRPGTHRGYRHVSLYYAPQRCKTVFIHRLVLLSFCGPAQFPRADACHNDGDRGNNHLANLRWATRQQNMDDRTRHGRTIQGTRVHTAVLNDTLVLQMRAEHRRGASIRSLAIKMKIGQATAHYAVTGKTWSHLNERISDVA